MEKRKRQSIYNWILDDDRPVCFEYNLYVGLIMEFFNGIPIRVVPANRKFQNRKHKKKRINKKYIKRYGFTEIPSVIKDGKVISTSLMIVMNENTYRDFKIMLEVENEKRI